MIEQQTKPESIAWEALEEELRPQCRYWSPTLHGHPERQCGRPATWWDKCVKCGGILYSCDPCHDYKLISKNAMRHTSCGGVFIPVRASIAEMGRL